MNSILRRAILAFPVLLLVTHPAHAQDKVDFNRKVLPILAKRCFHCHGPETAENGLRVNTRDGIVAKLESGERAVIPGKPAESELLKRIAAKDENERMPPEGEPLSKAQIEVIRRWIAEGAKWEKHFAFQSPMRPAAPPVKNQAWVRNPIDALLLKPLEDAGLEPAPPADKLALLRRVYYNVTGLPPTPEVVRAFLDDDSPAAYERVVDRLLASPHYGEKWGRHWLDLVRFAETNSFERDGAKPNAWRFRDYVIRSFNADKPYDQFIKEQLAGDELPHPTADQIIATGYYRLGLWDDEPADPLLARYDELDDIVRTTAEVFLGLSVGCARCHDHKIDPIPQSDYYSFVSFFHGLSRYATRGDQRSFSQWDITPPEVAALYHALDVKKRDLEKQMRVIEQRGIKKMSAPDQRKTEGPKRLREKVLNAKLKQHISTADWTAYAALKKQVQATEQGYRKLPQRQSAMAVARVTKKPEPNFVLLRGNPRSKGDKVVPAFLKILGGGEAKLPKPAPVRSSGRRTALANWIASGDNMLTARVITNRLWQHHFGRGIVRSPNNFGLLGDRPTHPLLLDYLAMELVGGVQSSESRVQRQTLSRLAAPQLEARDDRQSAMGTPQSLKRLHRLILTSAAYRMSSRGNAKGLAKDPANDLFWRFNMRRLSAEEIRDSVHVVNGRFNGKMHGPSIYPEISREVLQGQSRPGDGWGRSTPEKQARRSVYVYVKRSLVLPFFETFDFADTDNTCPVRFATTQPSQALNLLNGKFLNEQAVGFANRLRQEGGPDRTNQVTRGLQLALCRKPQPHEIQRGLKLMDVLQTKHGVKPERTLDYFCLMVLNLNEFVYLD